MYSFFDAKAYIETSHAEWSATTIKKNFEALQEAFEAKAGRVDLVKYLADDAEGKLLKRKVSSIKPTLIVENRAYIRFECEHDESLTPNERGALVDYLEGQLADGWGENTFQLKIPYGRKERTVFLTPSSIITRYSTNYIELFGLSCSPTDDTEEYNASTVRKPSK